MLSPSEEYHSPVLVGDCLAKASDAGGEQSSSGVGELLKSLSRQKQVQRAFWSAGLAISDVVAAFDCTLYSFCRILHARSRDKAGRRQLVKLQSAEVEDAEL